MRFALSVGLGVAVFVVPVWIGTWLVLRLEAKGRSGA